MNKKSILLLLLITTIPNISFVISQNRIVPESEYKWPNKKRGYWPTTEWKSAPLMSHGIDPKKLIIADSLARLDNSFRSFLVIKNGFIIFERYYHGGSKEQSTEVWSVTKSFTSALLGIAIDNGHIESVDKLMIDYLPNYKNFRNISIRHVLSHTTGLNWDENSLEEWVKSEDWIENALNKGYSSEAGRVFLYSSGNSHFISKLILETTGKTLGEYANDKLFNHLGINLKLSNRKKKYSNWQELHVPTPGSWRQDNNGMEIGAFGLHVTAREMAKFGFLYLNKGKWNNKNIISENWIEESTKDHVLRSENKGFGFHWVVSKRVNKLCFEADGWGGQMISVIPELDMVVVIKCDAINPRGYNSYKVLELAIGATL